MPDAAVRPSMKSMTTSIDPALVARLSGEFSELGTQMGVLGRDLELLHTQVLASSGRRLAFPPTTTTEPAARDDAGAPTDAMSGAGEALDSNLGADPACPAADEQSGIARDVRGDRPASSAVTEDAATPPRTPAAPDMAAPTPSDPDSAAGAGGSTGSAECGDATGSAERFPGGSSSWPPACGTEPRDASAVPGATSIPPAGTAGSGPAAVPPWGPMPTWPSRPYSAPPTSPVWGSRYQPPYLPPHPVPTGAAGGYAARPGTVPPPGSRQQAPARTPWWQRDGVISRILAVAGVAVTLIGVVMLLVLAAQAGLFGPVPRVVAGAVFSAGLVAAGFRVYKRPGGRVGGIALATTGVAGAYLDVVAVTSIYHWLHPVPGLAAAAAVAAVGVGLAVQWQSQPFAVLVVAGAGVFSAFITTDLVLLAFLIVLQLACVPVQTGRDWPLLHIARTLPAVLATLSSIAAAAVATPARDQLYLLLAAAAAVAVVGVAGTVFVVRHRPTDIMATLTFAAAAAPLLTVVALFERRTAVLIAAVYAVVLLAVAVSTVLPGVRNKVRIPGHTATAAAVTGAFALLEACVAVTDGATLPIALFLVALGFLGVAGQLRSTVGAALGAAFTTLGGLAFLATASPETLALQRLAEQELGTTTAIAAVTGLAVIAVGWWALPRVPACSAGVTGESLLWVAASAVMLYLVTAAAVAIGTTSGADDGFVIGHSIATIMWMAGATGALLYGLRNLAAEAAVAKVALGPGLLVTAAALAKLFLFDLATLDGLIRVAAFLAVGILLLVVGTRYATAFAEVGARNGKEGPEKPQR